MSDKQTVNIGGRLYDAHTGLAADPAPQRAVHAHASKLHATAQHSQTLDRQHTKRPVTTPHQPTTKQHEHAAIAKSPAISRFAPHPQVSHSTPRISDIRPLKQHPIMTKVETTRRAVYTPALQAPLKPSDIIKKEAIEKSLNDAPSHSSGAHQTKRHAKKRSRVLSIISASFALILLAGYLTYLNMPNLSVRVAAAQAGIDASYPQYHPDGYSLKGTVSYKEGEVAMRFASNAGPQNFSLTQQKSAWDSSAVREFVSTKTNGQYLTDAEKGVTIYTYGGNAAWVSGGILYTINGSAPLSGDQIRHIASSM